MGFGAVALFLAWRVWRGVGKAHPTGDSDPHPVYRIRGTVEVRNACGDPVGRASDAILVHAVLRDERRNTREATVQVDLAPGPSDEEDGPDQVGEYAIEIGWSGPGTPTHWESPRVTRTDGTDVCGDLACGPNNRCVNLASRPRRIPVSGQDTPFLLRVACICVPQ